MATVRRHDYVPQNPAQFGAFMQNLLDYADMKLNVWTNIPQARFDELVGAYEAFQAAFQATIGPHSPAQNLARTEAQAECTRILRAFVNQFLRFPPVTNVDRAEMGIPNHDTIRTDHIQVPEMVDFVIHLSSIRELVLAFQIQGADHRAKPEGYEGAVIIWHVGEKPPASPDDFNHHIMASRTPFTLHFEEAERGKTVWIALCWQNERGFRGAWSEFKSAIIP
jgi:hypothetical protein